MNGVSLPQSRAKLAVRLWPNRILPVGRENIPSQEDHRSCAAELGTELMRALLVVVQVEVRGNERRRNANSV